MAGTVIADRLEAASTSQLVIENGVALTPPTIADVNGVAIGTFCRAWVNFNGSGTVAIRASFNVTSITDNATGDYTVNFTNVMPDANYCVNATVNANGAAYTATGVTVYATNINGTGIGQTASSIRLLCGNTSNAVPADFGYIYASVFR